MRQFEVGMMLQPAKGVELSEFDLDACGRCVCAECRYFDTYDCIYYEEHGIYACEDCEGNLEWVSACVKAGERV